MLECCSGYSSTLTARHIMLHIATLHQKYLVPEGHVAQDAVFLSGDGGGEQLLYLGGGWHLGNEWEKDVDALPVALNGVSHALATSYHCLDLLALLLHIERYLISARASSLAVLVRGWTAYFKQKIILANAPKTFPPMKAFAVYSNKASLQNKCTFIQRQVRTKPTPKLTLDWPLDRQPVVARTIYKPKLIIQTTWNRDLVMDDYHRTSNQWIAMDEKNECLQGHYRTQIPYGPSKKLKERLGSCR